jgi:hypothetical protein
MIEYNLVLLLTLATFVGGFVGAKVLPLMGFVMVAIDLTVMFDVITTGTVVIGYSYSGGVATAITQTFSWFPWLITISMLFAVVGALLKMVK